MGPIKPAHMCDDFVADPHGCLWDGNDIRISIEREFAWLQCQVFPMWDNSDPRVEGK